jgi:hypothetical protein
MRAVDLRVECFRRAHHHSVHEPCEALRDGRPTRTTETASPRCARRGRAPLRDPDVQEHAG